MKSHFITGSLETKAGLVPQISCRWTKQDYLGSIKVRCGINRDRYRVDPGLYSIGVPDHASDVLVTANYKLTFNVLRRELGGMNVWLVVLNTKGVNVWCAAGKGTFGTDELISKIDSLKLNEIVSHRRLILPQLGATGVSAHEVKKATGFSVFYGPVRAKDIKAFIVDGYRASKAMRTVTFPFKERAKLLPNDLMYGKYYLLAGICVMFLLSGLYSKGFSLERALHYGIYTAINIIAAYLSGIVFAPLLLPYLPFRSFSMKGLITGLITTALLTLFHFTGSSFLDLFSWFLLICSISSFMMMNFTGSSTYTSLSGVRKEMRRALPVQISSASLGLIIFIVSKFL
jgi:acetyl-CoA decarbonylase/synthase complex subunit gamma